MLIQSKLHKEIVGRADGQPYHVLFDADGYAEVEEAVGGQLLRLHAAEAVPESEDTADIRKMNPAQLKKYAKDNGIDVGDASKKAELLAIIEGAGQGGDEE